MKSAWMSIAIAFVLSTGCDESTGEPDMEMRSGVGEPCGLVSPSDPITHPPTYDCAEMTDMGYAAGVPFEIVVVTVDDDPVERNTANAYWVMREAAAQEGVDIHINSGFRTMEEQEYFWMCYNCCCCNDCNEAASPGYSNHQSGSALDLSTSNPGVYGWLAAHGNDYGFYETVASEDWHWEYMGGGPGGGICGITAPPGGNVDAATCETISGWAQDPDAPTDPIEVQVVFDGALGDPGSIAMSVLADVPRDDLCKAIGSCEHGFEVELPLGLRDDELHGVRVYAMDHEGEMDAELAISAPELGCPPPAIPPGVRRHVPDSAAFAAWGFSELFHLAHVDDAAIDALDEGVDLGEAPFVVTTAGSTELWLVEHGWRRAITAPVAEAWGFSIDEANELEPAALELIAVGPPVRDKPFIVIGTAAEMWLVDDPLEDPREDDSAGSADDGDESADDGGSDGGSDDSGSASGGLDRDDADTGCGCNSTPRSGAAPWLVVLAVAALRRRRT